MASENSGIGALLGGAAGSIIPGLGTAVGSGLGGLFGGALGGIFGKKKKTETQTQQQQLIDQLLSSLGGEGPYSSLFSANQADFEKGFAEPARARFQNQTAPQIQQGFIQGGQQRSTGLQDTLTRAGVDMDQLLNEHFLQFQQGKEQNQLNTIQQLLGHQGTGENQSFGSAAGQGIGGYLSSDNFGQNVGDIFGNIFKQKQPSADSTNAQNQQKKPLSEGFES